MPPDDPISGSAEHWLARARASVPEAYLDDLCYDAERLDWYHWVQS